MDAMAAAAACAVSTRDARLPDFSMDKPEVWFSMVEAMFKDCNVTNSKQKYNKVLSGCPWPLWRAWPCWSATSRT
jgi:hypothetical protein